MFLLAGLSLAAASFVFTAPRMFYSFFFPFTTDFITKETSEQFIQNLMA